MPQILRRIVFFIALGLIVSPVSALAAPAGSTQLVSRPDGTSPVPPAVDNDSETPGAVSADGRYVVFRSNADGMAPGADPHIENLFLRDTVAGTTTLVSRSDGFEGVAADQSSKDPAITVSPAGHVLVAFVTGSANLSDHITGPVGNPNATEVWLRDVTAGTTTLITRTGATGAPLNEGTSPAVAWSNGGPLVAYHSQGVLFLRTVDARSSQIVSCAGGNCVTNPVGITGDHPDLRVVNPKAGTLCAPPGHVTPCVLIVFEAFGGAAPDSNPDQFEIVTGVAIAPGASGLSTAPFGEFHTVSVNGAGVHANQPSFRPSFNADGTAVSWVSTATNLTGDLLPASHPQQAYFRTLQAGSTNLLSTGPGGAANADVDDVQLGGDLVHLRGVFRSSATNLGGTSVQTYLRDVPTGTTSLLNRAPGAAGAAGNGFSIGPALSADASTAIFESGSSNLGSGHSDFSRVFARRIDAAGQPVELVSRPSGAALLDSGTNFSDITATAVSADGRYVAFTSGSDNLSSVDDDDAESSVFVRDLVTGHTVLVSRATGADGAAANAEAFLGGISANGRRVSFTSDASNLAPGTTAGTDQAYVRDLDTNTTTLVGRATGADTPPPVGDVDAEGISANGNAVLVRSATPLDPAAGQTNKTHLYVRDLVAQTTTLVDRDNGPNGTVASVSGGFDGVIDADGGRVAFSSSAALAGAPADKLDHVYLRDVRAGTTTLVDRAEGPTGTAANDESFRPAIDADGNVVAFTSLAANLGATGNVSRIWARDVAAGHNELISVPIGAAQPTVADFASIDAAGDRVSFAVFGLETPAPVDRQIYVRDRVQQSTTLASRADGPDGAPAVGDANVSSLSANGDCVAFEGRFENLNDGFASADFPSVHMRALRNTCPGEQPASPPGNSDGPTTTTTTTHATPVALSALSLSRSRFHVGGAHGGTTVRFTLSAAAHVTLRIARLTTGHRHGTRCATGGHGRACALVATVGSLTVSAKRGRNSVRFSGKLKGHALRAGRYRLTATPAGGQARTATFTVLATAKRSAK